MDCTAPATLTDLYELTMLQGYLEQGMHARAVFEFFVRRLPRERNFLVAAGLEQVLDYLESVHFTPEEIDWLARSGRFSRTFVDYLTGFRFSGDVHAMPEGTVFFADEPILRVSAPLPEAQLVETRVINLLHLQTLIASKAARCVLAAPDRVLVDFGLRRAHGAEAGLYAARASYLAGFTSTATVSAGIRFAIPVSGTMAHSFVQAHENEETAFEHFARAQPNHVILLIDTYDTEAAARKVVALAARLRGEGIRVRGVRLDSGDLAAHARAVRAILDAGGLNDVEIFASGNLDEHVLARLLGAGAPIDGFGIGTRVDTSADAPYLDCAYKLEEYEGRPRRKRSEGKATWPGRKQVFRPYRDDGTMAGDVLALADAAAQGEPLLEPCLHGGRRIGAAPTLAEIRRRTAQQLARLPAPLRALHPGEPYPVEVDPGLKALVRRMDEAQP
jgi:nicotinate phosphoribosyltransferase